MSVIVVFLTATLLCGLGDVVETALINRWKRHHYKRNPALETKRWR